MALTLAKDRLSAKRRDMDVREDQAVTRMVSMAISRAQVGDRDAVGFLFARYSEGVYGQIRSIVRDEKEAEDLTQHVFTKLVTMICKYDDTGISFSGWLLLLARNAARDHLRRCSPTPTEDIAGGDGRHRDEARERAHDLQAALASLPDEQREVMVMRHIVGLLPSEIAERMGHSESSIHGLHHRGRRALQQELSRLGCAPSAGGALLKQAI